MHKRSSTLVYDPCHGKETVGLGLMESQEVAEGRKCCVCHLGACLCQALGILLGVLRFGWSAVHHPSLKHVLSKQAGPDVCLTWRLGRGPQA